MSLHEEIRKKIMKNNVDYKNSADSHRRLRTFNVSDYVMVRMRPERFPLRTVKKLHARSAGPFWMLKKINSNTCVLDLPSIFGISCTFNVENLVPYRDTFNTPSDPFVDNLPRTFFLRAPITSTSSKITLWSRKYKFHLGWLNCLYYRWRYTMLSPYVKRNAYSENSWIIEDFQQLGLTGALPQPAAASHRTLDRVESFPPQENWWGHHTA